MKSFLRRASLLLLLLLVVAGGLLGLWSLRSAHRVRSVLQAVRVAGLPTSVAELAPAPIPAEENAAPLYLEAFALAKEIPALRLSDLPQLPDRQELGRALAQVEPALALLRRAVDRPQCQFPHDFSSLATLTPVGGNAASQLARLLAARAVSRIEEADSQEAIEDVRALFHLGRSFAGEPSGLSQMMRLHYLDLGFKVLELILPASSDPLATLVRAHPDDARGASLRAVRSELLLAIELIKDDGELRRQADPAPSWVDWLERTHVLGDVATCTDVRRRQMLALGLPYPQAIAVFQSLAAELQKEGGPVSGMIAARLDGKKTSLHVNGIKDPRNVLSGFRA